MTVVRGSVITVVLLMAFSSLAAEALAAWSTDGSGSTAGAAATMPGGLAPTARASGNQVTLSWPAATLPDGTDVAGYTVQRYDAANGAPGGAVGGTCNGVVTTTTCTDQGVPNGTWVYTDTPVELAWTGAESPASNAAATLT